MSDQNMEEKNDNIEVVLGGSVESYEDKSCRVCRGVFKARRLGRTSDKGWVTYIAEDGRKWLGSMCPDCSNEYRKSISRRKPKAHFAKRKCECCGAEYTPKKKNASFCSRPCAIKFHSLKRTTDKNKLRKGMKNLIALSRNAVGSTVTAEDIGKLKTMLLDEKVLNALNEILGSKDGK